MRLHLTLKVVFFVFAIFHVAPQELQDFVPLNPQRLYERFQVPSRIDAHNLFVMLEDLNEMESDIQKFDQQIIIYILDRWWGQDNLVSQFAMSYLRLSRHQRIRAFLQTAAYNYMDVRQSAQYRRMMMSRELVSDPIEGYPQRYSYKGELFEEFIPMHRLANMYIHEDTELYGYHFEQDYNVVSYAPTNGVAMSFGGLTQAGSLIVRKLPYSTREDLDKELEYLRAVFKNNYNEFREEEVTGKGVFENAGADRVFHFLGAGTTPMVVIDQTQATTLFVSERKKCLFELNFYMNISQANINWPIREDLFLQNALLSTLSYIETKTE